MQCFSAAIVAPTKKRLGRLFPAILISYVASIGIASAQTADDSLVVPVDVRNEGQLIDALVASASNQQDDIINLGGSEIELTKTIVITNEAGYQLEITGGTILRPADSIAPFRLLQITGSGSTGRSLLKLDSMIFENGEHVVAVAGLPATAGGAAVFSAGIPVEIVNSTFSDNVVEGVSVLTGVVVTGGGVSGGAVLVSGSSLSIDGSTFNDNQVIAPGSDASGGAIATFDGSGITVVQSSFNRNLASRGGAIAPDNDTGVTSILQSTFSSNNATGLGGAIWARSTVEIELSTFYSNNADSGGGALFFQPLIVSSSGGSFLTRNTLVENTGGSGDAILFGAPTGTLPLALRPAFYANLIIGNNTADGANNCAETSLAVNEQATPSASFFSSQLYNISDDLSCGDSRVVLDGTALFSSVELLDNGGPTRTIALAFESTAINAGGVPNDASCTRTTDQRGFDVVGNVFGNGENGEIIDNGVICDAGSYEFNIVEFDTDVDGILNDADNCPVDFNPNQEEADGDKIGDVCDNDIDGDELPNDDDLDDDGDKQSDLDEIMCGSDPADGNSTSPDADGNGVPDCAEPGVVTVYQNVNFGGNFLSVEEGDVSFRVLRDSVVGNDRISSIEIADGFEVIACQHGGFNGRCELFTDSVSDLRSIGFNNIISSFRVRETSTLPVTVYRNVSFGGDTLSVGEGDVSFGVLRNSRVGNDRISSIQIADGYEVIACQHGGFNGRCEIFTDSVFDLRSIGFNDVISSFRVRETSLLPVTVFRDVNFGGDSLSVGEGEVSFRALRNSSVGNDRISSIQIADGFEVIACQHGGFGGVCETFTGSVFDLREVRINGVNFNDTISSLRVQAQ